MDYFQKVNHLVQKYLIGHKTDHEYPHKQWTFLPKLSKNTQLHLESKNGLPYHWKDQQKFFQNHSLRMPKLAAWTNSNNYFQMDKFVQVWYDYAWKDN